MRKFLGVVGLIGALLAGAAPVDAQITVPHTFVTRQTISSSQFNENFDAIELLALNRTAPVLQATLAVDVTATYDLGSGTGNRFRDLWLSRNAAIGGNLSVTGTLGVTGVSTLALTTISTLTLTSLSCTSCVTSGNITSLDTAKLQTVPSDATKFLNGAATPVWAAVKDSDLSTSNITTNDATTAKHGFIKKLSNSALDYMDGSGNWSQPLGASNMFSTIFENLTRLNPIAFVGGVSPTISSSGLFCDTSAAAGASGILTDMSPTVTLEPGFGFGASFFITVKGTTGDVFAGATNAAMLLASSVPPYTTVKHFGFKIIWSASGLGVFSATQSNGTAESATVLDSTITVNDHLVVAAQVNSTGTGVNYWYWKNGGTKSAVTSITSNFPSTTMDKQIEISISSRNVNSQSSMYATGMNIRY